MDLKMIDLVRLHLRIGYLGDLTHLVAKPPTRGAGSLRVLA